MTDKHFNDCVHEHSDNLYRFILKNTRNTDDAKDIVQTAFEKMWVKRNNIDPLRAKSYLFTVAYHEMIDQIRKKKKSVIADAEQTLFNAASDHKKILQMALSRLSETQRSLVLLKDLEGYSYEEIGEITGLSSSQVKVYLHRARIQMRNFIGSLENVIL